MTTKRQMPTVSDDPVQDVRELWDLHVEFGLSNPAAYALAYGEPRVGRVAAAAVETITILQEVIARLGDQGRLRMSVDRATKLVHAGGVGIVLTLHLRGSGRPGHGLVGHRRARTRCRRS